MTIYYNSVDVDAKLNKRLVAYATSHKTITAEQQEALNNLQLLTLIRMIEQQQQQQ